MGRRKIQMTMVKDSGARQVTFSKRRSGLFKKADELATLCGAQVAIVVFSPGGKPFSFGHPSVESVSQCFLNQESKPEDGSHSHDESRQEADVGKLHEELSDVLKQLETEKKRGDMIETDLKSNGKMKFQKPISEHSLDELLKLKKSFEGLRENIKERVDEMEASASLLLLSTNGVENDDKKRET